ncbi:hypothetical protein CRYUN_Cryun05aG0070100 [Craigia yunnanensis]
MQAGIRTFRDDEDIERGKNIKDEIEKAILHESKISIVVFPKNYASSTWCLNELVKILEHRKSCQHIVLPVIYDVDPTQVKKQTGSYAEAFAWHEESFKYEMDMVQRWRATLKEVADLGGMVLQDSNESPQVEYLISPMLCEGLNNSATIGPNLMLRKFAKTCKVNPLPLKDGKQSLSSDESSKNPNAILDEGIRRILKNCYPPNSLNLYAEFDGDNVVDDKDDECDVNNEVDDECLEPINKKDGSSTVGIATICGIGGIGKTTIAKVVYNQNIERFDDIVKGKTKKIYNADDGINKIKKAICCRRILLILDDVDDLGKITKIIGTRIPFHPGSKIIITSRHRYLLSRPFISQMFDLEASSSYGDLCKVFEVKELAFNESLHLFNWYAFGHNSIIVSFMEYASSIVKHCGGLPLALQVLGSSLSGKSTSVWKSTLEKLEAIPDSKIQKILQVSYDSLQDDHDKNIFLDIACLFFGKDRDYTTTILDGCNFYTTVGIENLICRSLLIVNENNKLVMHQMVRDRGREIIRQESLDLGKRSRLWHKEAFDVIREKIGSKTTKCLTLDLQGLLEDKTRRTIARNFKDFPKGLIWLRWQGFPLEYIPTNLDITRLVVLDMRNSSLKHVWMDTEFLPNLKILNLNHSHDLIKTPNFLGLPSFEKLMLKDCIKLIEVDQSIGELKTLTFLSLKDCTNLMKLPRTIGLVVSLEVLILSGCSRLDDVPRELHNMKSLRVLNLDETAIH